MIDEINTVWFEYKLIEYKINFHESLSYLHCINNKYNKTKELWTRIDNHNAFVMDLIVRNSWIE